MSESVKLSKGERTSQRLLDVAERLFAQKGFDGTSLRDVATEAGIREPGIYNHFKNKEALYCAVLERGLQPMADAIDAALTGDSSMKNVAQLPEAMTDLLCRHPSMPALFQQALMSSNEGPAQQLMSDWLENLFSRGHQVYGVLGNDTADRHQAAVRMAAMFNLSTGYFLSQKILDHMGAGDLLDEENIAQQKRLMAKIMRLFLLE